MKTISAKVIEHSKPLYDENELVTFSLEYGRIIHPELLRTRTASHSVKSSRAIPMKKYRSEVWNNPYIPVKFGKNQAGMQAGKETCRTRFLGEITWKLSSKIACLSHSIMEKIGVHKEITNRILEPFVWTEETLTIQRNDFNELVKLRVHPDAQPDISKIVEMMDLAVKQSTPNLLKNGEYHLPYVPQEVRGTQNSIESILQSAARCARSSYAKHNGDTSTLNEDMALAENLFKSGHWSPFEHQARPAESKIWLATYPSNLNRWIQVRKILQPIQSDYENSKMTFYNFLSDIFFEVL